MAKKVLVVDDEKLIVKGIRFSLEQDGMEVTCAYDGEEALLCAKEQKFDMILLDIMLPKLSGTEVCQQIREFSDVPIVMLTAKNDDMDKIMGLEYGADDYITKPFNILEVKARIKAIMRRTSARGQIAKPESILESGDMRVDCESRRVSISGREVNLTAKEFDLLELMVLAELAASKGEARRLVQQGGVTVDDQKIADIAYTVTAEQFKDGQIIIKKGKKTFRKILLK